MTARLVFRPEALQELFESAEWYEARGKALSADFLRMIENYLETLQQNPFQYQVILGRVRRAVLPRFPYSIIYSVSEDELLVIACFHGRRDPGHWRKRL